MSNVTMPSKSKYEMHGLCRETRPDVLLAMMAEWYAKDAKARRSEAPDEPDYVYAAIAAAQLITGSHMICEHMPDRPEVKDFVAADETIGGRVARLWLSAHPTPPGLRKMHEETMAALAQLIDATIASATAENMVASWVKEGKS